MASNRFYLRWNCFALLVVILFMSNCSSIRSFSHSSNYKVLGRSNDFCLYEKEIYPNKKSFIPESKYFFSYKNSDTLYELSISNLKSVFKYNIAFKSALDQYFHSEKELIKYDTSERNYTLILLYNLYFKNE